MDSPRVDMVFYTPFVGILGGLLLLGAVGTGIYYLCKGKLPCCCGPSGCYDTEDEEYDEDEL